MFFQAILNGNPGFTIPLINIKVYWYGVILASAALAGILLGVQRAKKRDFDVNHLMDFVIIAVPVSLLCARIFYVIFAWQDYASVVQAGDWFALFRIWDGGIAILGAVIGGVLSAFIFTRFKKYNITFGKLADIAAPCLVLGQALGRWGNFVNQEVFGKEIFNPALQWFPFAVEVDGIYYLALFFFEFVINLAIFGALLFFDKKRNHPDGFVFYLYLILYGVTRAFLESLRMEEYVLTLGNLPISQWVSVACILAGATVMISMRVKAKRISYAKDEALSVIEDLDTFLDTEDDYDLQHNHKVQEDEPIEAAENVLDDASVIPADFEPIEIADDAGLQYVQEDETAQNDEADAALETAEDNTDETAQNDETDIVEETVEETAPEAEQTED